MVATLPILLYVVHPNTIVMTGFRRGLRLWVLTHHPGDRCRDEFGELKTPQTLIVF